jgi:hypothetical protein
MQVEAPFRIDAAPLTAALVLFTTLTIGSVAGFAIGLGTRTAEATATYVTPGVVLPAGGTASGAPNTNGRYYADEGELCLWGPALECLAPDR